MVIKQTAAPTRFSDNAGFTLVELVVVIVILSIISVVAISRFASGNAFSAFIIRDQIISLVRSAQESSLGRADVSFTLSIPASDRVRLTTAAGGSTLNQVELDLDSVSISGDVNQTASCATTGATAITAAPAFVLNFASLGALANSGFVGSELAVNSAIRICLNDRAADSVCISPAGFAYAGDCDV